jgi:hypothetical protein
MSLLWDALPSGAVDPPIVGLGPVDFLWIVLRGASGWSTDPSLPDMS